MMALKRRAFLGGLAGILAGGVAPAAIGSGILMPVRRLVLPREATFMAFNGGPKCLLASDTLYVYIDGGYQPFQITSTRIALGVWVADGRIQVLG
jgi:hypothetical protein